MKDRVLRDFPAKDFAQIADTPRRWQSPSPVSPEMGEPADEDVAGFFKSAMLEEVRRHDFVLTPGRYVGAGAASEGEEPFEKKFAWLSKQLEEHLTESDRLQVVIRGNPTRVRSRV